MINDKIGFGANRVIIALPPCDLPTSVEWSVNLASMYWPLNISREFTSQDGTGKGEDIDILRNHIVGYALLVNARYLWFINNDNLPPSWALHRFIEAMKVDPKIMVISGMNETNVPESTEYLDEINQTFQDDSGEQFDILEIAPNSHSNLECTLIKVEVFNEISEPWFSRDSSTTSKANFCEKVMRAGYKVCAHTGVLCGHVDMTTGKAHWPEAAVIPV